MRINSEGILWKEQGGGRAVDVDRSNIAGISWMKVPRSNQLGVRSKDGLYYKFIGFRDQLWDHPRKKKLSVNGHNWGEVDFNDARENVLLEFHVDDTITANEKDSLMEISFHIPNSNTQFIGDENRPSAQVFHDKIMSMADVDAEEAVVTFDSIATLTPRGRYSVELHLSFCRLQGQANDFKIQYSSIVRLLSSEVESTTHICCYHP